MLTLDTGDCQLLQLFTLSEEEGKESVVLAIFDAERIWQSWLLKINLKSCSVEESLKESLTKTGITVSVLPNHVNAI